MPEGWRCLENGDALPEGRGSHACRCPVGCPATKYKYKAGHISCLAFDGEISPMTNIDEIIEQNEGELMLTLDQALHVIEYGWDVMEAMALDQAAASAVREGFAPADVEVVIDGLRRKLRA